MHVFKTIHFITYYCSKQANFSKASFAEVIVASTGVTEEGKGPHNLNVSHAGNSNENLDLKK